MTRPGVEFVIRDAFSRAKAYQKEWQDYERQRKAGEDVSMPRRDLQLEPLVEILEGKRLVHSHTYRADETLMLMRLAEEMGFKIATFQHIPRRLQGRRRNGEARRRRLDVLRLVGLQGGSGGRHSLQRRLMHKRGVLVSINSDSAEHARREYKAARACTGAADRRRSAFHSSRSIRRSS